jgi:hypothetical protein
MARRCARLNIIVNADDLDALGDLLCVVGSFFLGLDLCFALAVCSLGLFEDADNVLALGWPVSRGLIGCLSAATYAAHYLPRLVDHGNSLANSHGGEKTIVPAAAMRVGRDVVRPDGWMRCGT